MTKGPIHLDVAVGYAVPRAGIPAAVSFRKWVAAALAGRIREADLAIRIVDEKEGRSFNHHYRGKDYATNVLTFDYSHAPRVHADLVLCADVVESEAKAQSLSIEAHYAHLLVHGTLHAQGHDHERDDDAERMESRESAVLAALGFADPYAA